jgi:hypothetical protein
MTKVIAFNSADVNPTHTGIYVVDRGEKLGTPFRWFHAETNQWGRCEYILEDCIAAKDAKGVLPALPWRGPVKVLEKQDVQPLELVNTPTPAPMVVKAAKTVKPKAVKVAKTTKATITKHPDGTIFFREDRQKWVAMLNGKQEAARPTADACKAFLVKKGFDSKLINVIV